MLLILTSSAFAKTTIYRFSGAYVSARNTSIPNGITVDEILNLENSTKHPFPEFYFSSDREYSVTNWNPFPYSSRQAGSEFKLKISRRIDDVLYLSIWEFKYRFLTGWDDVRAKPKFSSAGGATTTESAMSIGRTVALTKTKSTDTTEWVIYRIDEVDTPLAQWLPAEKAQIKLITRLFESVQNDDAELLASLFSEVELSRAGNMTSSKILEFVKRGLPKPCKSKDCDVDSITFLYTGTHDVGVIKFILKTGDTEYWDIIKINNEWKIGK